MRGTLISIFLLVAACDDGCGSDDADAPRSEDVRPPEGITWEASIGGGHEKLVELRGFLPPQLRALLPDTPGAVLERLVPDLPIAGAVADVADVHAIRLRLGPMEPVVAAARISIEGDALGPDLPLVDGAPHGGRWVRSAPGPDEPGAMVLGDALIVTQHSAALERAGPWLAWGLVPGEAPDGIVMRLPSSAAVELRRDADAALEEWASNARASIRAERQRHEGAPPFGDPEELVDSVRTLLAGWIAYLPDVTSVVVHARPEASALVVDLDATVQDDAPLARTLGETRTISTASLLSLPAETAVAWSRASGRADEPSFVHRTLLRVGGERLDDAAKERITEVDRMLAEGTHTVATGAGADGPWLAVAASATLDPDPLRDALGSAFVRDVGGALLGCEGPLAPGAWETSGERAHRAVLCSGERPPELHLATVEGGDVSVAALTRGDSSVATAIASRLAADERGSGLGDAPDAARTIGALDPEAIAAGYVSPSRVLGAATLLAVLPQRPVTAGRTAPVAWSLARTEGGLRLRVAATETATEDLLGLVSPFFDLD